MHRSQGENSKLTLTQGQEWACTPIDVNTDA